MARNYRRAALAGLGLLVIGGIVWLWGLGGRPGNVIRVAHEDPELQAASKKAKSELDGFLKELANPKKGERFAIKAAFKTEAGPEYLWVRDPVYYNGKLDGFLDQVPISYKGAKKGDEVLVKQEDVYDWLIKDGATVRGGYTDKVLEAGRS